MDAGDGTTDIAVVELFNPSYDEATHTATYDISVLANWQNDLELGFQEEPADLSNVAADFGATHLFIDGCENTNVPCVWWEEGNPWVKGTFYFVPWSLWYEVYKCVPVVPDAGFLTVEEVTAYYTSKCNDEIPDCEGRCVAWI
jgi:hypothetical protein